MSIAQGDMTDKPDLDAIEARRDAALSMHVGKLQAFGDIVRQDIPALTAALRAAWEENERLQDEKTELWRLWQDQKAM